MNNEKQIPSVADAIDGALAILAELSTCPENSLSVQELAQKTTMPKEHIVFLVEMLQSLSDHQTGARIALDLNGSTISLLGDAGQLAPLRLTTAEAIALRQVLSRCQIDPGTRDRIERAVAPVAGPLHNDRLICSDLLFGGFFPLITEAVSIGARLRVSYRSPSAAHPRELVVDPGYICASNDAAYLVAWDLERDGQISLRMDRIIQAELTDDSVVTHPFTPYDPAESIKQNGSRAELRWDDRGSFEATPWAGIARNEAQVQPDGSICAPVYFTSKPWLFDQVLSGGGSIQIVEPRSLRNEFVAYAQALLA
ncbi:MAG: WYL domain-containing protein [Coriobacteriaceae bacterium]|nr:WYL domain-containing protein [Coriobacteriaceae bacterium]